MDFWLGKIYTRNKIATPTGADLHLAPIKN